MPEIHIAFSANAGVSLSVGRHRIWVDVLHRQKQDGFSTVSEALFSTLLESREFAKPDYICATHCHGDHYSKTMIKQAKIRWPDAKLCLPQQEFDSQIPVCGETFAVEDEDLTLEFIRLPHEGAQYADVKLYGILIRAGEKNILIAGDCETASPVLADAIADRKIDLAILNFPWITLAKGRSFLTQVMKPAKVLVCHLPFEQDDVGNFRASAQRNAQLPDMDIRLLLEPLQTEYVYI